MSLVSAPLSTMSAYVYGMSPYELSNKKQPAVWLYGLPAETILSVCSYLSVVDLCRLRATSRHLLALVSIREIWTQALRDIFLLKELPSLESTYPALPTVDLVQTVVRLTRQDQDFCRLDKAPRLIRSWPDLDIPGWDNKSPTLLPGGQHIAMLAPTRKRLLARATDVDEPFWDLLPPLEGTSTLYAEIWQVALRSPDSLSLAICTTREGLDGTGGSVRLFNCNLQTRVTTEEAVLATVAEKSHFYLTLKHGVLAVLRSNPGLEMPIWTVFLYDLTTGKQAEVHLRDTLLGSHGHRALPRDIFLLSSRELVVCSVELSPVYPLPDLRAPEPEEVTKRMPFAKPEPAELTGAIAAVQGKWEPYVEAIIVPPAWRKTGNSLPKGFLQWNQGTVTVATLAAEPLRELPVYRPRYPSADDGPSKASLREALRCPARGTFALTSTRSEETSDGSVGVYRVHIKDAAAANIRLGRQEWLDTLTWSLVRMPDVLCPNEEVWRMDMDEESGRFLVEVGGLQPYVGRSRLMVLEI